MASKPSAYMILPTNVTNKIELKGYFCPTRKSPQDCPQALYFKYENLKWWIEHQYLYVIYNSNRPCFGITIDNEGIDKNNNKGLKQFIIKDLTSKMIIKQNIPIDYNKLDYLSLNGCYLVLKEWKNESFPYRERNKEVWTNFLSLIYSREVNFNFEVHYLGKLDLSSNDKFFETNIVSDNYILPQLFVNNLRYHNVKSFFNKIKKLFFECDQLIDFEFYSHKLDYNYPLLDKFRSQCDWYIKPQCEVNNETEQFVMFKPNGYFWIKKVFELIGRPLQVTHIFVLQTKECNDYIKFFYPFCHTRPYGLEWYSYLQERPLIFVRFICDISINEFNWIKNTARTMSKFIWTKNIMHCYENVAEKELMKLFFHKLVHNKMLLDKEWSNQIDKIENTFKSSTTYTYKLLSNS